jgi:hypothetical protein
MSLGWARIWVVLCRVGWAVDKLGMIDVVGVTR